jgi:hypothetical protein
MDMNINEPQDIDKPQDIDEPQDKKVKFDVEFQVENYMKNMNEREKKAYEIAMNHLKSSFSMMRSNGFKEYLEKNGG